jgi:UDP-GlcNAc:undecaprenyl-phosphate GlcNAc-1-phosphate transferase
MLGLPLFDTCFAILRRLSKGQNPMSPDRSHVHHRLIDMGFSQKQAVAILYVISAILGLCAVVLTTSGALKAIVLLCALCLAGLIAGKISLSHGEPQAEKQETKEDLPHGIESNDHLRDPSRSGENGSAGEGAGEQTGDH